DRPRAERDVESRPEPAPRRFGRPHVRADGDVHANEPGARGEDGADQEADGRAPAELVVEAEEEERHDRDGGDGRVLTPQVGGSPFLDGLGDLPHALVAVRAAQQPNGQPDAVGDGDARADERKQHRMVVEEAPDDQRSYPLTKSAPSDPGAAGFLSHGAPWSAVSASGGRLVSGRRAGDLEPRLVEVAVLLGEPAVTERRDGVEGLDEDVRHLERLQLLLELLEQLVVGWRPALGHDGSHNSKRFPSTSLAQANRPYSISSSRSSTSTPAARSCASMASRLRTRKLTINCCPPGPKYAVSAGKGAQTVWSPSFEVNVVP